MATLYRKYRPQTFAEISGQEHVVETLRKAIEKNRLAHAYLFTGARGVGKTTLARLLAKSVNCLEPDNLKKPCGKCKNCLDIQKGNFIDLIEIDAASNRGIDEIRVLREKIQFAPSVGSKRVYIIDEVHMLTQEAFNALLKTLEEPPSHTLFIFATTEVHKVPVTILSRCQRFDFHLAEEALIIKNIEKIVKQEGFNISNEVRDLIVKASGGSFRDAQSLLDQLSPYLDKGEISLEKAIKVLNLASLEQLLEFVEILKSSDSKKALEYIASLRSKGVDFTEFKNMLVTRLREELIENVMNSKDTSWHNKAVLKVFKAIQQARVSPIDSLPLEIAAIDICAKEDTVLRQVLEPNIETLKEQPKPKRIPVKNLKEVGSDQRRAIIESITSSNKTLGSLLSQHSDWRFDENKLIIAVEFVFYKDKIMDKRNYSLIKKELLEAFGRDVDFECIVKANQELSDQISTVFQLEE